MAVDNKQIALEVLDAVGGKDNVTAVQHCLTRLRFNLKDRALADDDKVQAVKGVAGIQVSGGQYQVIVGQNVPKVYAAICEETGLQQLDVTDEDLGDEVSGEAPTDAPKEKLTLKKVGSNILNYLSGTMLTLIPLMMGASLCKCVISIIGPDMLGIISADSNIYILFDFVYDAGFYFLPIYLGYAAATKLGASPVLGMLMGGILLAPDFMAMAGSTFTVFGIPTTVYDYSQTVLPVLLAVAAMSYVEKFFNRVVPDMFNLLLAPFLTVLVMLPVSLCLLAPLGNYCGYGINVFLNFIDAVAGPFAVAIVSALWEFLVMTGMHTIFTTLSFTLLFQNGYIDGALIGMWTATFAVWGVALGAFLRLKDKEEKSLTLGYFISGALGGVTEPTIYGLCFKYKRTFIGLVVGGFAGGLVAGFAGVTEYLIGSSASLLILLVFTGGTTSNLVWGAISCFTAFAVATVVTFFTGFTKEELEGSAA